MAVCMNDPIAIDREDYDAGVAWHESGGGYSSGASAYFNRGWKFAYHRSLAFRLRHTSRRHAEGRTLLRHHVKEAKRCRCRF